MLWKLPPLGGLFRWRYLGSSRCCSYEHGAPDGGPIAAGVLKTSSSLLGYTGVMVSVALVVGVASLETAADVLTGCIESMVVTGISADAPEIMGWV